MPSAPIQTLFACKASCLWLALSLTLLASIHSQEAVAYIQDSETIHIHHFGAEGDGESDDTEAFRRALTQLAEAGGTIEISRGHFVVDRIVFPENVRLRFHGGGKLLVPKGGAVTIDGKLDAGAEQIFLGEGSVRGQIDNRYVYPQWFGARGDGRHDNASAMQKAADLAAESRGKTLFIPDGEYLFLDDITIRSNVESQGVLVTEIETDEERTRLFVDTFVPTHYPKHDANLIFAPDHEEIELETRHFFGVQEGDLELPIHQSVPLAAGDGYVDLAEGGTLRFYSSDFFSSRRDRKGDGFYDRNDIVQLVSGRGDVFPEFAFSYSEPSEAEPWQATETYQKGDYVTVEGTLFRSTWPSGEGSGYEHPHLGAIEIGPVTPDPSEATTRFDFTYDDGTEDSINLWRRVETQVWYREPDRPLSINGLRVEVRLKNHGGEAKRIQAGAVIVNRSNMTFNNLHVSVRDPEANMARLLSVREAVNLEFNNGYFSGATYHGLGYNILNFNVANVRYINCTSTNSRKGMDGRHAKNVLISGGFYNVIDDHYGRNYTIRDVVMSGQSTYIPGYTTPDADHREWGFRNIRAFAFTGANLHIENVTIHEAAGGILAVRSDIGELYGRIVLRGITVRSNEGDVRIFSHWIDPDFDYAQEVGVPDRLVIEDVHLENPGRLNLNIGSGFTSGTYGPTYVRNTGPIGNVSSSSSSLTFSGVAFEDADFEVEADALVNFRNNTFSGTNAGLDIENVGTALGNIRMNGADLSFPLNTTN